MWGAASTTDAEAPDAGPAKVTVVAGTGLPNWSKTVRSSCVGKSVLTTVLWLSPALTLTEAGLPGLLVKLKLADAPPAATASW